MRYHNSMDGQKVIGIIGGGQLAKNLTLAAIPLGFKVIALEPAKTCVAAQAGAENIDADLKDPKAIRELVKRSDFVTVEIEHMNTDALAKASAKSSAKIRPSAQTLQIIEDKYGQKLFFQKKGIPLGPFAEVNKKSDVAELLHMYKTPVMLKTRFGAYNGLGNALVKDIKSVDKAWKKLGGSQLYAEKFVNFRKELAVMAARDINGNIVTHPVVQTIHERNICQETLAPAGIGKKEDAAAQKVAKKVVKSLSDVGIFGVEMFLTTENKILLNEVAPRVHNSGHYTLDACLVSQFEQHIRAITGLPLGETKLMAPAAVMINILGERNGNTKLKGVEKSLAVPETAIHIYGKSPTKIDRKMGHITSLGSNRNQAKKRAEKARKVMDI